MAGERLRHGKRDKVGLKFTQGSNKPTLRSSIIYKYINDFLSFYDLFFEHIN